MADEFPGKTMKVNSRGMTYRNIVIIRDDFCGIPVAVKYFSAEIDTFCGYLRLVYLKEVRTFGATVIVGATGITGIFVKNNFGGVMIAG